MLSRICKVPRCQKSENSTFIRRFRSCSQPNVMFSHVFRRSVSCYLGISTLCVFPSHRKKVNCRILTTAISCIFSRTSFCDLLVTVFRICLPIPGSKPTVIRTTLYFAFSRLFSSECVPECCRCRWHRVSLHCAAYTSLLPNGCH